MEQLVHLRLKSIYKAFKSSTTSSPAPGNLNHDGTASHPVGPMPKGPGKNLKIRENDDPTMATSVDDLGPSALMLAAAASAAAPASQLAAAAAACATAASLAPNSQLAAAAQAAAALGVNPATVASDFTAIAAASEEDYEKERIKAEKAAAELLAELDEEEQAVKTKKSKKKKKKERQQAKKAEQVQKEEEGAKQSDTIPNETKTAQKNSSKKPSKKKTPSETNSNEKLVLPDSEESVSVNDQSASKRNLERKTANSNLSESATHTTMTSGTLSTYKADEVGTKNNNEKTSEEDAADPQEEQFNELVENEDIEGLEELLSSIKGVPGKAILRKNVKKALKRLRVLNEVVPTNESVPEAVTPALPATQLVSSTLTPFQSPKVADLLTIVSQTHNKVSSNTRSPKGHPVTPKSEVIMHMHYAIVGWVIGKGGQRIRDLMEESGARIWIDQDSIGPQEPRVVYVSGQRSSVESAVKMITDLIAKAPIETPNSKSKTPIPASTTDQQQSRATLPSLAMPKISSTKGIAANSMDKSGAPFLLKPREATKIADLHAKREMTCDPRFVPLLIGRRGWTIKNIQDNSGARVDIDQNVTPRKIIISGSPTAVEVAVRMVGEVLSYPQSLLHGTEEENIEAVMRAFPGAAEVPKDFFGTSIEGPDHTLPKVDNQPFVRAPSPVDEDAAKATSQNSPPSSLIVAGDGKSTISATSSLSSTPEPSLSTNKANQQQQSSTPAQLPHSAHDQQRSAHITNVSQNAFDTFPQGDLNSHNLLQGGLSNQNNSIGIGLGSRNTHQHLESFPQGLSPQTMGVATNTVGPGPSLLGQGSQRFAQPPMPGQAFPVASHGASQGYSTMPQPNAYTSVIPPSPHGIPSHLGIPSSTGMPSQQHYQPQQLGSVQAGNLWNARSEASEQFRLQEAVNFLQHNENSNSRRTLHSQLGNTQEQHQGHTVTGIMGLSDQAPLVPSLGMNRSLAQAHAESSLLPPGVKEDAKVVESLFGTTTQAPRDDPGIVPGLQGLSLDPAPHNSDNPWAAPQSSNLSFSQMGDKFVNGGGPVEASSLFATESDSDRRHSRFSWGESG